MPKDKPKDYPYIRAWGRYLGSENWYVFDQVDKARSQNAPQTAIYEQYGEDGSGPSGVWRTLDDLKNPETLQIIKNLAKEFLK